MRATVSIVRYCCARLYLGNTGISVPLGAMRATNASDLVPAGVSQEASNSTVSLDMPLAVLSSRPKIRGDELGPKRPESHRLSASTNEAVLV